MTVAVPSTKPLDGEFWYVLDDEHNVVWRPRPKLRGDFYLGWLGQNKNVAGAGLVRIEQGRLTHICTHGTPYYWLQPYEALNSNAEMLRNQQVLGADTMFLDFSLAGWGMREQTPPKTRQWSDAPVSADSLQPLLSQTVDLVVQNFRSEGEPPSKQGYDGLLARATADHHQDPIGELLGLLKEKLGELNVVPVLVELVKHDLNVLPHYRQSGFYENLPTRESLPPPNKLTRLMISAVYHLAPLLGSRRLNSTLLLNSLRQRHPFDVTWGADSLIKCFGMSSLVRLLFAALLKERDAELCGNVLDLLQEMGYGFSIGLEPEMLKGLTNLLTREDLGSLGQVVNTHLTFIQEYVRQRDSAHLAD